MYRVMSPSWLITVAMAINFLGVSQCGVLVLPEDTNKKWGTTTATTTNADPFFTRVSLVAVMVILSQFRLVFQSTRYLENCYHVAKEENVCQSEEEVGLVLL